MSGAVGCVAWGMPGLLLSWVGGEPLVLTGYKEDSKWDLAVPASSWEKKPPNMVVAMFIFLVGGRGVASYVSLRLSKNSR